MFGPDLTMPKRLKFFLSSLAAAILFFILMPLPYESVYPIFGVMLLALVFVWWFGLSLWKESWWTKMATGLLAWLFWGGFALFSQLLPYSIEVAFLLSLVVLVVWYVLFLVENIFLVAIGFKTVPLYRAAWTVSLLLTLLTSFFVFNTIWSFRWSSWINSISVFLVTGLIFAYTHWVISIETGRRDFGKNISSVLVPSIILAELTAVLSFWPLGIFRASMYLVWGVYMLASLLQVELRERLFKRTLIGFGWLLVGIILSLLVTTSWR